MTGGGESRNRYWTADEDARLRELIERGLTQREIGEIFGRTRDSVSKRCQKINVRPLGERVEVNTPVGWRRFFRATPERLAQFALIRKRAWTPEMRAKAAERARAQNAARVYGPRPREAVEKQIATRVKNHYKKLGLPPRGHPITEEYNRLVIKVGAKEALRLTKERIAKLPSMDRAMLRLQLGAALIEKQVISKDYDYTLGGVGW